jgi:hypothetical protein
MTIAAVTRELLVRYLDTWAPGALHQARRATFLAAWSGEPDLDAAEAALRVFAEYGDRLGPNRRLTLVFAGPRVDAVARRLEPVQRELTMPAELAVHALAGDGPTLAPAALTAAEAAGGPVLAWVVTDGPVDARRLRVGRAAELVTVTPAGQRPDLEAGGYSLSAGVELVAAHDARVLCFATSTLRSLEAFKNELWAVDEFAGVRFRDPGDPERHLIDISLNPHPGPLRRVLLAHLAATGGATVTDLRQFTLTRTVYRAADTTAAVTSLLASGTVGREPAKGRLAGDVRIIPGPAGA